MKKERSIMLIVCKKLILLIFLSVTVITSMGQIQYSASVNLNNKSALTEFRRLYTGDVLPPQDFTFSDTKNYAPGPLKWSSLKSKKLIILDFWSKYCSSCIAAFPKMEELQKEFNDDIQIILITPNNRSELAGLFNKSRNVKNAKLPMVMGDSVFSKFFFPHNTVPFHVWIDRDGKVVATTYAQETTRENISAFLSGKDFSIPIRNDKVESWLPKGIEDPSSSLINIEGGRLVGNLIYYSQIPEEVVPNRFPFDIKQNTGQKLPYLKQYSMFQRGDMGYVGSGAGRQKNLMNNNGERRGIQLYNYPLFSIIAHIAYKDLARKQSLFVKKSGRIVVDSSAKKYFEEVTANTNMKRYYINNVYSYESNMDNFSYNKSMVILREDIAKCFGIRARIERRALRCIVMKVFDTTKLNKLWAKDTNDNSDGEVIFEGSKIKYIKMPIASLFDEFCTSNSASDLPFFINETNISNERRINMTLHVKDQVLNASNLENLREDFYKYGIDIIIEFREADILTIYSNV